MRKLFVGIAGLVLLGALGAFARPPVMVVGSEATDGIIYLYADDGDDSADKWSIHAQAAGDFTIKCNGVVALTISSNGTATVTGASAFSNTLSVVGVATFTAESVHNGGIDADYITTDAAAGIDTKTAGTLAVGASTATKVEIGDTGVGVEAQGPLTAKEDILSDEIDSETATTLLIGKATATSVTIGASDAGVSVPGTLGITGVATFTAIPKFNAAVYAPGTVAGLITNAPAGTTADAKWMKVTYGTTNACIPMFIIP